MAFVAECFEVGKVVGARNSGVSATRLHDVVDLEADAVLAAALADAAAILVAATGGPPSVRPPVILPVGERTGIRAPCSAANGERRPTPAAAGWVAVGTEFAGRLSVAHTPDSIAPVTSVALFVFRIGAKRRF